MKREDQSERCSERKKMKKKENEKAKIEPKHNGLIHLPTIVFGSGGGALAPSLM